jgi:hypothetical protein
MFSFNVAKKKNKWTVKPNYKMPKKGREQATSSDNKQQYWQISDQPLEKWPDNGLTRKKSISEQHNDSDDKRNIGLMV